MKQYAGKKGGQVMSKQDPVWDIAWSWVVRQHEEQGLDDVGRAGLAHWLAQDPAHVRAYDKAGRLWLMAGLVPPRNEVDGAGDASPDGDR